LAIARTIRLGGQRNVQLRIDLFNAFNTVVISARTTAMQLASPATATTVTNSEYLADGTLNPARLTPQTAGFGAASAAQALRTAQVQLRFQF
jgi:hypothetical protein